jgi:hypothetical protein
MIGRIDNMARDRTWSTTPLSFPSARAWQAVAIAFKEFTGEVLAPSA